MIPSSSATVTVLALLAGACAAETSTDPAADLPLLVRGNTEFALTLFGRLGAESPEGNLFLSPLSVSAALGMTADGAGGGTAAQMDSVLRLAIPGGGARRAFPLLLSQLSPGHRAGLCGEGCEPLTLEIANALWVERSFPLLDTYVDLVGRDYGAVARNVDFVGDPEGQRLLINDWVDEATSGRITDLLPPGVITAMTRVVLTNAIYFKASWMTPFDERATAAADFTLPDGSVVAVPTMHRTDWFAFGRRGGCAAISLPYSDGMSSMLVLLPDGDLLTFFWCTSAGVTHTRWVRLKVQD